MPTPTSPSRSHYRNGATHAAISRWSDPACSAIALSSHGPARGEPLAADNGLPDLRQQLEGNRSFSPPLTLEGLLHRTEEETGRQRKRLQQNVMERDLLYEKMLFLAKAGPTFGFEAVNGLHPVQRVRAASRVGETGKIYMCDFETDDAHTFGVVDWHEFSKAVDLAKSLEHVDWRPVPARTLKHVDGKKFANSYGMFCGMEETSRFRSQVTTWGPIPIRWSRN